jgi:crotonobetainyl-CoA:carnitine CoA-transferase CaiB-like acyl-CoA transferase
MNDHLTGYLLAIAVVAALAEREEKGGYWRVDTSLTRCSTFGTELGMHQLLRGLKHHIYCAPS